MGKSSCFLTNAFGAHILVWNVQHVIKVYVKGGTNIGCRHQNEIKTRNSLPTLDKEEAGHCWGANASATVSASGCGLLMLPEEKDKEDFTHLLLPDPPCCSCSFHSLGTGHLVPCGSPESLDPSATQRESPCSTLPYSPPHSLATLRGGREAQSKLSADSKLSSSPRTSCNMLVGRLIWGSTRKDALEKRKSQSHLEWSH